MIDLTNKTHQRGLVMLGSQEYRTVIKDATDISVYSQCILSYIELLETRLDTYIDKKEEPEVDGMILDIKLYTKSIKDWANGIKDAGKNLEKLFR